MLVLGLTALAAFGCGKAERTLGGTWKLGEVKELDGCAFLLKWAYVFDGPPRNNAGGIVVVMKNTSDSPRDCSVFSQMVGEGDELALPWTGRGVSLDPGAKLEASILAMRRDGTDGRTLVLELDSAEGFTLPRIGVNYAVESPPTMPWTAAQLTTCNDLTVTDACPPRHAEALALRTQMQRLTDEF